MIRQNYDGDLKNKPEKIFLLDHHSFEYVYFGTVFDCLCNIMVYYMTYS